MRPSGYINHRPVVAAISANLNLLPSTPSLSRSFFIIADGDYDPLGVRSPWLNISSQMVGSEKQIHAFSGFKHIASVLPRSYAPHPHSCRRS
jgi:hypothetical protein